MIDALVAGRLATKPKRGTQQSGTSYAMAVVWVPLGNDHLSVSAVALEADVVDELLALSAGDAVALAGELIPGYWKPRDGKARFLADLEVRGVLTPYRVQRHRDEMTVRRIDQFMSGEQFPPTQDGETQ